MQLLIILYGIGKSVFDFFVSKSTADNMQSVSSGAVAEMISNNFNGLKLISCKENAPVSITTDEGVFFYGAGDSRVIRVITTTTTVTPTNTFFGDPASGYNKKMIGIYK